VEQSVVEEPWSGEGDHVELFRHGEDDVEVRDGKELALTRIEPLLSCRGLAAGTVTVATGAPLNVLCAAAVAALTLAAECGSTAAGDGAEDLAPMGAQRLPCGKSG
jgi:hypothetical protein